MTSPALVKPFTQADVASVARVHQHTFPRQRDSLAWVECNARAFPRVQYYVAERDGQVVGIIQWMQRSGFREQVVLELEQLGVDPAVQGLGIAKALIRDSLPLVRKQIGERGATLKHVMVSTRADNQARRLYESVLGAREVATVRDLYSADEVLLVARNVPDVLPG